MENFTLFIGRFHPLLVHLPIGILLVAVLFDWLSKNEKYAKLSTAVGALYFLGGIGAVLSCLTGYLLSSSGEYEGALLDRHQWMGIGVAAVALLMWGLRILNLQQQTWTTSILSLGLFGLISWTGHLGGSLTHGEDYLFVHAPEPLRTWALGESEPIVPIQNVQEALVYQDIVVPMLKKSCYKCHSEKKQKGKLRLDTPEFLAKGGKSQKAVVKAGVPTESELIKRLLLPRADEKHMPPSRKDELNEAQIKLLQWWITQGADYEAKVKTLSQPESVQPLLLALEHPTEQTTSDYENIEASPADPQAIEALKAAQVVVLPIGTKSNLLSINFVNVEQVGLDELRLLEAVPEQVVWLRLSNSTVTDEALKIIAQLPNLTKLYLNHTPITDAGLAHLLELKHLSYLNLVATNTTVEGIAALATLPALRTLYLYKTQTSSADKQALIQLLENIEVDTGGYHVPTFSSDTTFVSAK